MNGSIQPCKCMLRHPVLLIITVTLGLALGTQTTAAKECQRETPLPADIRPVAPGPEMPEAVTQFAGV